MEQADMPKDENTKPEKPQQEKKNEDWENWVATKREVEIDENGNKIVKNATYEYKTKSVGWLRYKDVIDISLRFIGLFAIAVPIFLFYSQQQAERNKQRALLQVDIFSKTSTLLHSMVEKKMDSSEFENTFNSFYYDCFPKISLLGSTKSKLLLQKFKDNITLNQEFINSKKYLDSLGIVVKKLNYEKGESLERYRRLAFLSTDRAGQFHILYRQKWLHQFENPYSYVKDTIPVLNERLDETQLKLYRIDFVYGYYIMDFLKSLDRVQRPLFDSTLSFKIYRDEIGNFKSESERLIENHKKYIDSLVILIDEEFININALLFESKKSQ